MQCWCDCLSSLAHAVLVRDCLSSCRESFLFWYGLFVLPSCVQSSRSHTSAFLNWLGWKGWERLAYIVYQELQWEEGCPSCALCNWFSHYLPLIARLRQLCSALQHCTHISHGKNQYVSAYIYLHLERISCNCFLVMRSCCATLNVYIFVAIPTLSLSYMFVFFSHFFPCPWFKPIG